MKESINPTTKNREISFTGKLVSLGEKVLQNSNGKNYRVGSLQFKDATGKTQTVSTLVYEGNYSKEGFAVGNEYASTAIFTPGQANPLITTSHLSGISERATADMFGVEAESLVPAIAE